MQFARTRGDSIRNNVSGRRKRFVMLDLTKVVIPFFPPALRNSGWRQRPSKRRGVDRRRQTDSYVMAMAQMITGDFCAPPTKRGGHKRGTGERLAKGRRRTDADATRTKASRPTLWEERLSLGLKVLFCEQSSRRDDDAMVRGGGRREN